MLKTYWRPAVCGCIAGIVNGLLGAGGGMVLIPLLNLFVKPKDNTLFSSSVCIMLPICLISLGMTRFMNGSLPWLDAWPYLLGSAAGGIFSGIFAKKIPTLWLHKGLGILIIGGGIRYLC